MQQRLLCCLCLVCSTHLDECWQYEKSTFPTVHFHCFPKGYLNDRLSNFASATTILCGIVSLMFISILLFRFAIHLQTTVHLFLASFDGLNMMFPTIVLLGLAYGGLFCICPVLAVEYLGVQHFGGEKR